MSATKTKAKYSVRVSDLGCTITGTIDHAGNVTIINDGGCGHDCLGLRVTPSFSASALETLLYDRFVKRASKNMGERYDPKLNNLTVSVTEA